MPSPDAMVLTCGESSLQDCLESLRRQTLSPREVVVIENVYPAARACEQAIEELLRRGSRSYVQVDADMILHANCFETLAAHLEARRECFQVIGRLEDGIEGPVWGIRIYRTEVIPELGGFRDVLALDRDIRERAERRGWKTLTLDDVLGYHNPVYTPESAFKRYSNKTNRLRGLYGMSEKTFRLWHNQLKILIMNYANKQDAPAIAALAGHFCGMLTENENTSQDSDYGGFTDSTVFRQYMEFFSHYADPLRGNSSNTSTGN